MGTLFASPVWTPSHEGGDPLEVFLSNHGAPSLLLLLVCCEGVSTTITHFIISCICFGSIFPLSLAPTLWCWCCCRGLVCLWCSLGASWPPGLSSLFYDGVSDGSMLPAWYSPSFPPEPLFHPNWLGNPSEIQHLLHHQEEAPPWAIIVQTMIASPGANSTASVIHSSRQSWNMLAINEPIYVWGGGGWSPPPSPKVTLTWTQ